MCVSAGFTATACLWRRPNRCMPCTSIPRAFRVGKPGQAMLAIFLWVLGIPRLAAPASELAWCMVRTRVGHRPVSGDHGASASTTSPMLPQKLGEQPAHVFRLLLLHPVTSPVQHMTASHVRAGAGLHALEVARALIHSPVA